MYTFERKMLMRLLIKLFISRLRSKPKLFSLCHPNTVNQIISGGLTCTCRLAKHAGLRQDDGLGFEIAEGFEGNLIVCCA